MRAAWRVLVAGEAGIDAKRLVFVDEMGANTSLSPLHAWSRRGERARCSRCRATLRQEHDALGEHDVRGDGVVLGGGRGHHKGGLRSVRRTGAGARAAARAELVVVDNLAAHKGEEVRELVEARGCELLFLPPYSPDYSPIEEAFSKIKALLRKAEARTREALIEAMGRAISAVTARDARGFFEHCGYRLVGQLL